MDTAADTDVSPHLSAGKQTRILIWRSEVISHLPPLLATPSPSSNSSVTSGSTSSSSSGLPSNSRPAKLWARFRGHFSTNHMPSFSRGKLGEGGSEVTRTEMYKHLAAEYAKQDGSANPKAQDDGGVEAAAAAAAARERANEDWDGREDTMWVKQERLFRAAQLLEKNS